MFAVSHYIIHTDKFFDITGEVTLLRLSFTPTLRSVQTRHRAMLTTAVAIVWVLRLGLSSGCASSARPDCAEKLMNGAAYNAWWVADLLGDVRLAATPRKHDGALGYLDSSVPRLRSACDLSRGRYAKVALQRSHEEWQTDDLDPDGLGRGRATQTTLASSAWVGRRRSA